MYIIYISIYTHMPTHNHRDVHVPLLIIDMVGICTDGPNIFQLLIYRFFPDGYSLSAQGVFLG